MQVCSRDWGEPAQANTARKTLPMSSKHLMQWLEGTKKERVLGQDLGLGGEVKAENAQGRCRGVGRDMVQVGSEFGARRQTVSQAGNKKMVLTKRAKRERVTRTKKNDKKPKRSADKKK